MESRIDLTSGDIEDLRLPGVEVTQSENLLDSIPTVRFRDSDEFCAVHFRINGKDFVRGTERVHLAIVAAFEDELAASGITSVETSANLEILGGGLIRMPKDNIIVVTSHSETCSGFDEEHVARILKEEFPDHLILTGTLPG